MTSLFYQTPLLYTCLMHQALILPSIAPTPNIERKYTDTENVTVTLKSDFFKNNEILRRLVQLYLIMSICR